MQMASRFRAGLSGIFFRARITGWELAGIQLLVLRGLDPLSTPLSRTLGRRSPAASPGCFCSETTAIAPPHPVTRHRQSALSPTCMRSEHCGNFSVAHWANGRIADTPRVFERDKPDRSNQKAVFHKGYATFAATRDSVDYLGFTSVPVNVNVPSAVPPPSRGSPWSGKLVSVMVPATFVPSELNVKV